MTVSVVTLDLRAEEDVVAARQLARQAAAKLRFEPQEQTRVATAVSEIVRNALMHAGGGRLEILFEDGLSPQELVLRVLDSGPGIADLEAVMQGRYRSKTGLSVGLTGSRRLMDHFEVRSEAGEGTSVTLGKKLPAGVAIGAPDLRALTRDMVAQLAPRSGNANLLLELHRQQEELLRTNLALAEARQREAEDRARLIVENSPNAVVALNPDGCVLEWNREAERLFGLPAAQAIGASFSEAVLPARLRKPLERAFQDYVESGRSKLFDGRHELTARHHGGHEFPVELSLASMMAGGNLMFSASLRDISQVKQHREELERQANYDALTGLPNRNLLADRLAQALARAKRDRNQVGVVFVDLDNFKLINDSISHSAGDRLLQLAANRLKACVRESDTLARQGGDEFVLILSDCKSVALVARLMKKVLSTLAQPAEIDGRELTLSCSAGVSFYPDHGEDADTLLRRADTAMYQAKARGRDSFQIYTKEMEQGFDDRLALETHLRHALERKELYLEYQPQLDLAHGKLVGFEALVRWKHPELGAVSPGRFIPLAEDTGLIVPIGVWILRTACLQNKTWQDAGLPTVRMAVNVSARQFQRENFVGTMKRVLRDTRLEPRYLELELTESLVMRNAQTFITALGEMNAIGVQLSIDDFGTGYSSLSYLKRFPIDRLKVDQSFVRDIATDPDDAAIVSTIISLGHMLGLKVVAEGVETEQQLAFLRQQACDEAQGYFFSRPMPAAAAERFLRENR